MKPAKLNTLPVFKKANKEVVDAYNKKELIKNKFNEIQNFLPSSNPESDINKLLLFICEAAEQGYTTNSKLLDMLAATPDNDTLRICRLFQLLERSVLQYIQRQSRSIIKQTGLFNKNLSFSAEISIVHQYFYSPQNESEFPLIWQSSTSDLTLVTTCCLSKNVHDFLLDILFKLSHYHVFDFYDDMLDYIFSVEREYFEPSSEIEINAELTISAIESVREMHDNISPDITEISDEALFEHFWEIYEPCLSVSKEVKNKSEVINKYKQSLFLLLKDDNDSFFGWFDDYCQSIIVESHSFLSLMQESKKRKIIKAELIDICSNNKIKHRNDHDKEILNIINQFIPYFKEIKTIESVEYIEESGYFGNLMFLTNTASKKEINRVNNHAAMNQQYHFETHEHEVTFQVKTPSDLIQYSYNYSVISAFVTLISNALKLKDSTLISQI